MANDANGAEQIEAPVTINIGNLCKGAIIDAFEKELQKCLDNIYDLDTPATTSRTITLKVKLKPDDARIKIAAACAHNHAASWGQSHTGVDRFAVFDRGHARTIAEMGDYETVRQIVRKLLHDRFA